MAETCGILCPMVLIVGILVGAIAFQWRRANEAAEIFTQIAKDLDLEYTRSSSWRPGEMEGLHQGFRVKVWVFRRGSGKSKKTLTAIQTWVEPPLHMQLKVYREGFFSSMGKALGFQDIQTGDREFDERFMIKGIVESDVLRLLNQELRREILRYDRSAPPRVTDTGIYWEEVGIETDPAFIKGTLHAQSRVVQVMSRQAIEIQAEQL